MDLRTPEDFRHAWTRQALQNLRLVLLFEDPDLALVPGPGAMSLAGQLAHLCSASEFTVDLLREKTPSLEGFSRLPSFDSVREACRILARCLRRVQSAADSVDPDLWSEPCPVLGPDWNLPRRDLAFLMLEHGVHHTGALHVYARIAGKVPPKIYAPVDESLLHGLE